MIDKIIQKLNSFLGYDIKVGDYYNKVAEWKSWYDGYVKDFHSRMERGRLINNYSMGMAKKVGEDYASMVINEQTMIKTPDKDVEKFLIGDEDNSGGILKELNFWKNMNDYCERMYGYAGAIACIVGLDKATLKGNGDIDGGKYTLRFVTSEHIIPISWDGSDVSEAAFYSTKTVKGNTYVILEIHRRDEEKNDGSYIVETKVFLFQDNQLLDQGENGLSLFTLTEQINFPFKPFDVCSSNISNNFVEGFPLGIPAIANAIDEIKTCDIYFNNFAQDGALGKKRVFISEEYVETEVLKDNAGNVVGRVPVDPEYNQSPFYVLKKDNMLNGGTPAIYQEFNPVLRVTENKEALQQALNMLSLKVGLGNQFYVFQQAGYVTATQVRVSNLPLTYNINKQRTPYWRFIQNICHALLALANTNGKSFNTEAIIDVEWDDSLLKDPELEKTSDLQAVAQGIMTAWEFRVKWMGDTEEEAKRILSEEKANNPTIEDFYNQDYGNNGNE